MKTLTRRDALKTTALLGTAAALRPSLFAQPVAGGLRIVLEDLPYPHDALEPAIDEKTMRIHHENHHGAFVRNLQNISDELRGHANIESLLRDIPLLPESIRTVVRNNGGGHYNHDLFWKIMAPPGQGGGGLPQGPLAARIQTEFGSYKAFTDLFSQKAAGVFGSGWAWLILTQQGRLAVTSTPNQDNPLMRGLVPDEEFGTPILGLDVWEHAYYLRYQYRRGDYISNWWKVVNWQAVGRKFEQAI
jgi:Fe-Mn family superoxide dismutase